MDVRRDRGDEVVVAGRQDRNGTDGGLVSLAGSPLAGRFCAWRGESGRRYVVTVHPVDRSVDGCGLPDYEAFVLIAVRGGPLGRRVLDVVPIERASERHLALARGLAQGADEWHVHFLADDRRARAAMISDLRARHLGGIEAARCA